MHDPHSVGSSAKRAAKSDDAMMMRAGVGVAAAMAVCCLGPVLLAAGALGVLAGVLVSPAAIGLSIAGGLIGALWWRRHRAECRARCEPPTQNGPAGDPAGLGRAEEWRQS